jgi:outer membrane lipoprotein-sorting protein
MSSLPVVERHPSLRWLVPAGVAVVLITFGVDVLHGGGRSVSLPAISAADLVRQAKAASHPYAGTALAQVSGDTSALAGVIDAEAPSVSLARMAPGSHTLRVWYAAPARRRVALVDPLEETDLFRAGSSTWEWYSAERLAVHGHVTDDNALWTTPVTPADLALRLLAGLPSVANVTVAGAEIVAGREAYGLVLRPSDADSLVDYVHIALDGATKTPLAVEIYPRNASDAAVDVAFTSIAFTSPPAAVFDFRPPQGALVRQAQASSPATEYGAGWTSVVCYTRAAARVPASALAAVEHRAVRGTWGSGRLVQLPLVSALLTKDGRAYIGPVTPARLYAAAAAEKGSS